MTRRRATGRGRLWLIAVIAGAICVGATAAAFANNLDRRTAINAAKQVTRHECQQTTGCTDYFVRRMHRVSHHKWTGRMFVVGARQGTRFICVRQVVITLDPVTGEIHYATSARQCRAR